jgi:hypothetical protein
MFNKSQFGVPLVRAMVQLMFLLAALSSTVLSCGAEVNTNAAPDVSKGSIAVDLEDGSRIVGVLDTPLAFTTAFNTMKLDTRQIESIETLPENNQAIAHFKNGDRLHGSFVSTMMNIRTVFGMVSIPVALIRELHSDNDLRSGLVAYFRFEGNGEDSIGDHLLRVGDGTMNMSYLDGNTGQAMLSVRGATPSMSYSDGKIGQAITQTGNASSFRMPRPTDIDLEKDFTVSVWAYREESIYDNDAVFDNGSLYIAKRDAPPWNSRMGVLLSSLDSKRTLDLVDNSSIGKPPLHTWFHVIVFRRGNTVGMRVNNEGTATVDVSGMKLQGGPLIFVGQQQYGYPWQGRLDELGIWNRALTPSEMTALYNNGRGKRP